MKICHINVRLDAGGAAKVALDLHKRATQDGHESRFLYGYGRKGGSSALARGRKDVMKITSPGRAAANRLLFPILNYDPFAPPLLNRAGIRQWLRWADVIHLHCIHSYMSSFEWLLEELATAGKGIVWTAHDPWMITGRCAILQGCNRWQHACDRCAVTTNYPPVFFDRAASVYGRKRAAIERLGARLQLSSPGLHVLNDVRQAFPEIPAYHIANGLAGDFEQHIVPLELCPVPDEKRLRVLVTAHDLSDGAKTNHALVRSVAQLPGVELHTAGKRSPFSGPNVINHGFLNVKSMARLYCWSDVLLFSSTIDTNSLAMIESICCGTPVLACRSEAAQEILKHVCDVSHLSSQEDELVANLRDRSFCQVYYGRDRASLRKLAYPLFTGEAMYRNYRELYVTAAAQSAALAAGKVS